MDRANTITKRAIKSKTSEGKPLSYAEIEAELDGERVTFAGYMQDGKVGYAQIEESMMELAEASWEQWEQAVASRYTADTYPFSPLNSHCYRILNAALEEIDRDAVTFSDGRSAAVKEIFYGRVSEDAVHSELHNVTYDKIEVVDIYEKAGSVRLLVGDEEITVKAIYDGYESWFEIRSNKNGLLWHGFNGYDVLGTPYEEYSLYLIMCKKEICQY